MDMVLVPHFFLINYHSVGDVVIIIIPSLFLVQILGCDHMGAHTNFRMSIFLRVCRCGSPYQF